MALAWLVEATPVGLVKSQPDLGSALVRGALSLGVIAMSGAPRRRVVWVISVVVIGITVALGLRS